VLAQIPNLPLDDVPDGVDERGNVGPQGGRETQLSVHAKQHFELGERSA